MDSLKNALSGNKSATGTQQPAAGAGQSDYLDKGKFTMSGSLKSRKFHDGM